VMGMLAVRDIMTPQLFTVEADASASTVKS